MKLVSIVGAGIAGTTVANRNRRQLPDAGAHLLDCRMAVDVLKRTKANLVPLAEDLTSAEDFHDKAAGSQVVFI